MSILKAIFKKKGGKDLQQKGGAGPLREEEGWYYEESQDFSRSQSTVRIEQERPGGWEVLESSRGIVGLNKLERKMEVERFFAGSYRWLQLDREINGFRPSNAIRIIGTYRNKSGKEHAVHLGFLEQEICDDLSGRNLRDFWAQIRFIKRPVPGRSSKYMVRFDLMKKEGLSMEV